MARFRIVARGSIEPPRGGRLALAAVLATLLSVGLLGLMGAGGGMAGGMWEGLLYLFPALLLLLVLLARRYPGERLLVALVARRARRVGARVLAAVRRIELQVPRGGRLIAVSLAGRAPPAVRAGTRLC